jgi:hypothetical protein
MTAEPRGVEPDSDHLDRYSVIFDRFRYPQEKLFEASAAASFQSKRSEGGSREWIREKEEDGLIRMVEVRPGKVLEIRGKVTPSFDEALNLASKGSHKVMVSAVLEPLKVRLITKGDSYRYWLSRFYQKALWKYLQSFPQFVLTGRPLGVGDLIDLKAREAGLGLSFPKWVSGDYSSATDSLDIRHTKAAFEASLRMGLFEARPKVMEVLRSVLYEQEVHYPAKSGLAPVKQTTGQLMGSTLSFPILCVVNLVSYWRALEKYLGREIGVRDLPVLVNGDDILFRADDDLYDLWQKEIRDVGFELSLGKNYIHEHFLTVNSQLYSDLGGELRHLGCLNAGLLTGQSKITGRDTARLAPIWDYYNEVIHNAINPERAHRRFMHYHRNTIKEISVLKTRNPSWQDGSTADRTVSTTFNLFLPFERGGLGFIPFPGMKVRLTRFQRRYASYLESAFLSEPEKIPKIALVSKRTQHKTTYYHEPRWIVGPKIGPQQQFVSIPEDKEVWTPPLALAGEIERPEMVARLPYRQLKDFRSTTRPQMADKDIFTFGWQLLEQHFPDENLMNYQSEINKNNKNNTLVEFLEE